MELDSGSAFSIVSFDDFKRFYISENRKRQLSVYQIKILYWKCGPIIGFVEADVEILGADDYVSPSNLRLLITNECRQLLFGRE